MVKNYREFLTTQGGQTMSIIMYKIVRFTFDDNHPDNHKVIKTGLTEEEAQEHCRRDDTRKKGVWFDGYTEERGDV